MLSTIHDRTTPACFFLATKTGSRYAAAMEVDSKRGSVEGDPRGVAYLRSCVLSHSSRQSHPTLYATQAKEACWRALLLRRICCTGSGWNMTIAARDLLIRGLQSRSVSRVLGGSRVATLRASRILGRTTAIASPFTIAGRFRPDYNAEAGRRPTRWLPRQKKKCA